MAKELSRAISGRNIKLVNKAVYNIGGLGNVDDKDREAGQPHSLPRQLLRLQRINRLQRDHNLSGSDIEILSESVSDNFDN